MHGIYVDRTVSLWFTKRRKLGNILLLVAFLLLLVLGYGGFSKLLLITLEQQFSPLLDIQKADDMKWVVVLGGGVVADPALPVAGQLLPASCARLMEGIRIKKQLPASRILLSGGHPLVLPRSMRDGRGFSFNGHESRRP
jgi:uncharacterized SAM-binding protein YcdF (DUF218 family)